jgi:membrane protein YdbS with pleckstrin-like domain
MTPTPADEVPVRRHHRRNLGLGVAGALAIAVHLGVGGVLLANPGWTVAADVVLVVVLGKVLLIILARLAIRRHRAAQRTEHVDAGTGDHRAQRDVDHRTAEIVERD